MQNKEITDFVNYLKTIQAGSKNEKGIVIMLLVICKTNLAQHAKRADILIEAKSYMVENVEPLLDFIIKYLI